jgi:hypothetical protein
MFFLVGGRCITVRDYDDFCDWTKNQTEELIFLLDKSLGPDAWFSPMKVMIQFFDLLD